MKKCSLFITIVFSIYLVSCHKNNHAELDIPAGDKVISSVVFKAGDNPGFTEDVAAVVSSDSIKVNFSQNVTLTHLVASIVFKGRSISPANRTAQDFTNPVTYTVTAEDGSVKRYLFAVNLPVADTASLLSGKWSLFEDSVFTANHHFFTDLNGHSAVITPGVYYGSSMDYYDFKLNGNLSVHENGNDATSTYIVLPNHTLKIRDIVFSPAAILKLNSAEATFYWTDTSTNGGLYARTLTLVK